eukprot:TRINITY_DN15401_c0_g1_i1.p1 TRINITY_DN15401_c0_g1~~TRINITY_DN15401_c0_g1_i1.p1  ORF type:complete len:315 (+),score=56.51 TRINITY_DN15401_c0_g1_i1:29-973(+)
MDLDALMAEMCAGGTSNARNTVPVSIGSSGSTTSSSSEETTGSAFTLDDLDSLMSDIQSQSTRRRLPGTYEMPKMAARKTTARKTATGALDGSDLDSVLDSIMGVASSSITQDKSQLGWGLVDTKRDFDLRAPEFTLVNQPCESTIIVKLMSGERTRVPIENLKVELVGMNIPWDFRDNEDGTYTILFTPTQLGKVQLNIDCFGVRHWEWVITVSSSPDPAHCEARVVGQPRVNQKCEVLITARDSSGGQFQIGGAQFGIGFNGVGELNEVGLADNLNGTYSLFMTPNVPGEYAIFVSLGDVDIKDSPVIFTAY